MEAFGTNFKLFGIYYDSPALIEDKNESRAIIGGCFDLSCDLQPFLLKHPNYKITTFKNLQGFGAKFPLLTPLNVLSAVIRGYPKIMAYGIKKQLTSKAQCSLEFYDYNEKSMTIAFPYYQGNESILFQSGYPIPKSKNIESKKRD